MLQRSAINSGLKVAGAVGIAVLARKADGQVFVQIDVHF
jgi:hypothetical protein